MASDTEVVLVRIAKILESLSIPFIVGGSVASSIHGIPRSTQDIDILIELNLTKAGELAKALQAEFYCRAHRQNRCAQAKRSRQALVASGSRQM